ncbi:PepSY-associated TM helix domain-containing protein [Pseudoalteromonas sp. OOF1S-7]|uniref:PepSY-associated TM helix domain-containing protein n=1 Tax=Pseudoalteromonas sp. OOF1S-7 TaxID=2917757 RepID=UPI001EF5A85D|nr:PepSY-associated TM helix domain-containing protein [Pseudoalteromonas sp. OOF1S-7]MCG7534913.1 PepSY domain-containing protein [Pseudoalteromonas sp. OOF1S-7]
MKVRADILKTYQSLHTWTGITSSLLLFIGFFAGALTMFAPEIDRWATPAAHQMAAIDTDRYDALLDKVLQEYPKASDSVALHFTDAQSPVSWYEQGSPRGLRLDDMRWHATLDDNEQLITELVPVNSLSALLDMLHRTAGIGGEIGHTQAGVFVLGIAAGLYFLALVSGVIFLLPTLVKRFLAVRDQGERKRFWLDGHNLLGIASLPFHVVIAFTVCVFAFHDILYGTLAQIYGDKPLFPRSAPSQVERNIADLPKVSELIALAESHAPGYQVAQIKLSNLNKPSAFATIDVANEGEIARGALNDFIFINPYTLEVVSSSVANPEQTVWARLVSSFFGLHFGSYGGDLVRWAYFLMGIAGACLFYSGNILWLEKRRRKGMQQHRSYRIMGALTVGISLGALTGVAAIFASNKWLTLTPVNINQAYMFVYYACFSCVLISAFVYGPAKTAINALKVLALLCVVVPATSVLAGAVPALNLWTPNSLGTLMIEVMALVFALMFWWMSVCVTRRATANEPGSIWHLETSNAVTSELSIKHS